MLGFSQVRQKIQALDYRAFSSIVRVLKQLELYIREAKKLRDRFALKEASLVLDSWEAATNKIPSGLQDHVQVTNLTRCRAALQWLKRLF